MVIRFGDPQVIITANMDSLLALRPIASSRDISELRNIYDSIEIHSRNLEMFDVNSEHYGPILISVIMSKLPEDFRLDISRLMPAGKWELKHLLNMFKQELTSREKCLSLSPNKQVPPVNPDYYTHDENNFSASSLHIGTYKVTCSFCKMEHPSNKCHVVTDLSARKAILQEKRKCFNCLRTGHIVKNCSANSKGGFPLVLYANGNGKGKQ